MTRSRDTSEAADRIVSEGLRRMTPEQRFARAVNLTVWTHRMALAQLRRSHPEDSERQLRLRLAARILDAETMRKLLEHERGRG